MLPEIVKVVVSFGSVEDCDEFRASYAQIPGVFSLDAATQDVKLVKANVLKTVFADTLEEIRKRPGIRRVEKAVNA